MDTESTQTPLIPAAPTQRKRVAWIDFARYFAILFVCETHSGMHLINRNGLWAGASVFVFFFLAGYFNRKSGAALVKRCAILFICSVFWAFIKACITRNGLHFTLQEFVFEHAKFRNTMWFLQYMVMWMALSPLYRLIPFRWVKAVIPAALLTAFCLFGFQADNPTTLHITYLGSAGLFYLGMYMQGKDLSIIFPHFNERSARIGLAATGIILITLLILSYAVGTNHSTYFAVSMLFSLAYLMLTMSFCIEKCMPQFTQKVAKLGAATIFIYVCHAAIFHVWTGGYIAVFHSHPPVALTLVLAAVILLLGPWFYYKAEGRNRLLDILLFAK